MAGVRQLYGKYNAGETMPQINQFCALKPTVALLIVGQGEKHSVMWPWFLRGGRGYFEHGDSMLTERANEASQEKHK